MCTSMDFGATEQTRVPMGKVGRIRSSGPLGTPVSGSGVPGRSRVHLIDPHAGLLLLY
ncbi:hypothetical protein BV20DRAFT_962045 [Pilatotrama ljubarskyi]|nr:hypothetical protein BV20DRAFT_962045 [Pilatotrama ljubarskyi]